jgi:O-antigen/teichoic acid export membrane protein
VYSLVPILQRVLSVVLIRLYTHKLDTPQYGILELTDLLLLLLPQLVGTNLLGAMTRFFYDHTEERDRRAVISTTTIVLGLLAWVVTAIAIVFEEPLAAFLFTRGELSRLTAEHIVYFRIAILTVPFSLTTRAGIQYLQIHHLSGASVGFQVVKMLVEIALKLWMLFGLEWGVKGFLLSILIGEALGTVTLTAWVLAKIRPRLVWRVFVPLVGYTLPLVPVGLCQLGLHQFDRLMLKYLGPDSPIVAGASETVADSWVGIYGLGYKIAFLLHTAVLTSFMQIWQPWIFGMHESEERAETTERVGTWALLTLAAIYVPAILFGRQAVDLLAGQESYREAWRVAPWVALSYLFYGAYSISQVTVFVAKRTWPLFWINLGCLALNVALNFVLIPRIGVLGAAVATLGTFAVLALLGTRASRALGQRSFQRGRALAVFAVAIGSAFAAYGIDAWRDPLESAGFLALVLLLKLAACSIALALLWFVVLDRDGREGLIRLARDLAARAR